MAGLAVKHTAQLGRALYADRPFGKWEVVLVEAPCMVAGCAVPITDDAPADELFAAWRNQVSHLPLTTDALSDGQFAPYKLAVCPYGRSSTHAAGSSTSRERVHVHHQPSRSPGNVLYSS